MRNRKHGLALLRVWMSKGSSVWSANQAHVRIPGLLHLDKVLKRTRAMSGTALEQSALDESRFLKPPLRDIICPEVRELSALSSARVSVGI